MPGHEIATSYPCLRTWNRLAGDGYPDRVADCTLDRQLCSPSERVAVLFL